MRTALLLCLSAWLPFAVQAGEVRIERVVLSASAAGVWRADVTLRHGDTGWEHYADAWRIMGPGGEEIGRRVLFHPHETEQPFTRSLGNLRLPEGTRTVTVEAHDKVHGWSSDRVVVDLTADSGERYAIER